LFGQRTELSDSTWLTQ